jgi:hypothetical protein
MAWVEQVEYSLYDSHARRCISAIDFDRTYVAFARKVALYVSAKGIGQHGFSTTNGAGDDGSPRPLRVR